MLGLLAESSIHAGTGRGLGVVDLPMARESATDYPVVVGSSLKGALRDKFETRQRMKGRSEEEAWKDAAGPFGKSDSAGGLMISDARLLLLPVRSLTASYRWATCPHLIERFRRDLARAGREPRPSIPEVKRATVLIPGAEIGPALETGSTTAAEGSNSDLMFLEERQFQIDDAPLQGLVKAVEKLILHEETRNRVSSRLAVLHDDDFSWFARYGLSIRARNFLEDGTKQSANLWYEETLPPDTVMYALVAARDAKAGKALGELFTETDPYMQAGGNETVGQGWFAVRVLGNEWSHS